MFYVETEEGNVKVSFGHTTESRVEFDGIDEYEVPRLTSCILFIVDSKEEKVGDDVYGFGTAFCNPVDAFNKAVGRRISLTRALEDSEFSKEARAEIWKEYFRLHNDRKK